jgi:hypothetical protein
MEYYDDLDSANDDLMPDFEEGMGMGAWMAEGERDEPQPEPEEPLMFSEPTPQESRSLQDRKKFKSKKRPFEAYVDEVIEKANRGEEW